MTGFFDFEWGKDGWDKARVVQQQLVRRDEQVLSAVSGVLMASVVTARGRRLSPSSVLERLINSKRQTNGIIVDHLVDAWNIMSDQSEACSDRIDVLTELITAKHRNKTGVSETLKYQLTQTYESFVDFWVTIADMMTGFRTVCTKIFAVGDTVGVGDYLHRGMTRSQLLQAFGHELKSPDDEE